MPVLRREAEQHLARGNRHGAQLRAHRRCGAAAEGACIPRHQVGVAHGKGDGLDGYAQFFSDLLR